MADYKTRTHNFRINGSFAPNRDLRFASSIVYNRSKAKYDRVDMPDVSLIAVNSAGDPDLTNQDFTFTELPLYSDLDYEMIQASLSAEYALTQTVTLSIDGQYADLLDKAAYVYGDESGSIYTLRTGVRMQF